MAKKTNKEAAWADIEARSGLTTEEAAAKNTPAKLARRKAKLDDTIRRLPDFLGRDDPDLVKAMTPKK